MLLGVVRGDPMATEVVDDRLLGGPVLVPDPRLVPIGVDRGGIAAECDLVCPIRIERLVGVVQERDPPSRPSAPSA